MIVSIGTSAANAAEIPSRTRYVSGTGRPLDKVAFPEFPDYMLG
jgi:hypothetical protein